LKRRCPTFVCLQELKCEEGKFPADRLRALGYDSVWKGQRSWNGVAILARKTEGGSLITRRGTVLAACTLLPKEQRTPEAVMSIVAWIVVGIIAGWIAERLTGRSHGLLTNMIVGMVGSVLGGFLFSSVIGFRYAEGLNIASILVATVGAVLLLSLFGGTRDRRTWS
jgi:uncharacterized membrane protein YeaQ/YmgE (transglycosylase-associated protein family)